MPRAKTTTTAPEFTNELEKARYELKEATRAFTALSGMVAFTTMPTNASLSRLIEDINKASVNLTECANAYQGAFRAQFTADA